MVEQIGVEIDGSRLRVAVGGKEKLEVLEELPEELGDAFVTTAIDSTDVLVRTLELEVTKDKEVAAVLPFQVEPLMPFSLDEVVLEHRVLERNEEGLTVVVIAVPKSRLEAHLKKVAELGIEPEAVSCVPAALGYLVPGKEAQGVLHVGATYTTCAVVQEGQVVASKALNVGASQQDERFKQDVARIFVALTRKKKISQILTIGEVGPIEMLKFPLVPIEEEAPIATGLVKSPMKLNFRKGGFSYPHRWKRLKKSMAAFAVLALLLAAGCFGLGQIHLSQKTKALRDSYARLASYAGQEVDGLMSIEEIQQGSLSLQEQLSNTPETFPLVHKVPRVADVLAYLATHPQVMGEEGPYIEIQRLHYAMVRYPNAKRPNDHYQVRLDLEFTAKSPTHARAFHDALLEGGDPLDPKSEVKWIGGKDSYHVSLMLRDRTRYLSGGRL